MTQNEKRREGLLKLPLYDWNGRVDYLTGDQVTQILTYLGKLEEGINFVQGLYDNLGDLYGTLSDLTAPK